MAPRKKHSHRRTKKALQLPHGKIIAVAPRKKHSHRRSLMRSASSTSSRSIRCCGWLVGRTVQLWLAGGAQFRYTPSVCFGVIHSTTKHRDPRFMIGSRVTSHSTIGFFNVDHPKKQTLRPQTINNASNGFVVVVVVVAVVVRSAIGERAFGRLCCISTSQERGGRRDKMVASSSHDVPKPEFVDATEVSPARMTAAQQERFAAVYTRYKKSNHTAAYLC
jgi:hypothetical protein